MLLIQRTYFIKENDFLSLESDSLLTLGFIKASNFSFNYLPNIFNLYKQAADSDTSRTSLIFLLIIIDIKLNFKGLWLT